LEFELFGDVFWRGTGELKDRTDFAFLRAVLVCLSRDGQVSAEEVFIALLQQAPRLNRTLAYCICSIGVGEGPQIPCSKQILPNCSEA